MDEASRMALKRLIRSDDFELDPLFDKIKENIMLRLQGCDSPDQAFQLKHRLDATDDLRLMLQQLTDEESTV